MISVNSIAAVALALALINPASKPLAQTRSAAPTGSVLVQGTLNLVRGERVILKRTAEGEPTFVSGEPISFEAVIARNEGQAGPRGLLTTPEGTISFALHSRQDVGSLLRIENGTDRGLKYVAYVLRMAGGQVYGPARTSVCTVPAGKVVLEHWPDSVVTVIAAGFAEAEEDTSICESDDVNE